MDWISHRSLQQGKRRDAGPSCDLGSGTEKEALADLAQELGISEKSSYRFSSVSGYTRVAEQCVCGSSTDTSRRFLGLCFSEQAP